MGSTSSSTWKRAESGLAAIFGAKRRPLSGSSNRDDIDGDDSLHPRLWLESKLRAKSALWTLWRKTRDDAAKRIRVFQGGHKVPVLGIREKFAKGVLIVVHEDNLREVVLEYLAARSARELLEIEAGVRHRRRRLNDVSPGATEGAKGRD